jgi:tetratricopeptide (TPR) repeat protein
MRSFVQAIARVLLTTAPVAIGVIGCSTLHPSVPHAEPATAPRAALDRLVELQICEPDSRSCSLPAPPGLDGSLVLPLADAGEKARMPLERVASETPPLSNPPDQPAHDPDPEAVRRYIAGREKLLEGRAADALNDLEAAARLDPNSANIWREIGEANLALARRGLAIQAFERSISLGLREVRPLTLLGRDHVQSRRYDAALRLLLAARDSERSRRSAYLAVIDAELARALRELGYLAAARDAILEGLMALVPGPAATRAYPEINEVFRRRGELALEAGDISMRLGELDAAHRAYTLVADVPGVDQLDVLRRQVHLNLRRGASASAALLVFEHFLTDDGRVDDRLMPLVTFLARNTQAGEALAECIGGLASQRGDSLPASSRSRLVRTAASCLPLQRASEMLRLHARQSPRDEACVIDLLASLPSARAAANELVAQVRHAPESVETVADAVLAYGRWIDSLCDLLARERHPPAALLHTAMLLRLGYAEPALKRAPGTTGNDALDAWTLALGCEAACSTGDARERDHLLAALTALADKSRSPESRRACARTLHRIGKPRDAFQVIAPLVESDRKPDARLLVEAAMLASLAEKPEVSRDLLRRAIEADPFDESAYDALLSLHAPSGPLPDNQAIADIARDLRRRIPDSRLVRLISGQEYLSRSLYSQAQESLLSLMDENFEHPQALDMLAMTWERSASTQPQLAAQGAEWLRARLQHRPEAPLLLMALARVLAAQGQPHEGEALLARRLERWPMPEMARVREWIIREGLKDPQRADSLARERLERAPPTFENAVELAEVHLRRRDMGEAARALVRGLALTDSLSAQASRRVLGILAQFRPDTPWQDVPAGASAIVEAFDTAIARGVSPSPALLLARLTFVVRTNPDDTSAIIQGVQTAAGSNPDLLLPACARALDALTALDDITPALRFLPIAAALFDPPREELLFEWYRLTVVRGDAEDIERFLTEADAARMLAILASSGDEVELPDDPAAQRVELAYATGVALSSVNRTDLAMATYRRVLRANPGHAWTCNNLGYMLLETGGDLEEADRLIAQAHRQLPDDYHVTDSLAWVRYKRGMIADTPGEGGAPGIEGALSLLRRAVVDQGGEADPTILDHYGDALWRSGNREQAILMWSKAQRRLEDMLVPWEMRRQNDPGIEEPPMASHLRRELDAVKSKISDAQAGREPAVAPFASQ